MPFTAGSRLGPYEIVSLLGVGGMGEVYRATDTNLKRSVAIKALPQAVAADVDRLARFQREAELLATLNHPHIAAIYGLEHVPPDRPGDPAGIALVMELVEGPTLADKIALGLSLDESLLIARQIAEAIEAAHDRGVIHRDLKPANIKVRPDGTVKVLDFGLAKAMEPPATSASASMSPTLSVHATQAGVILGTAAYMSPEQARGKAVDKRADIWAFGCVLFEMLSGKRAFAADDITDTIVAVVSKEPDWQAIPAAGSAVRPLIARCLKKDPRARLRDVGDARIQIDEIISGTSDAAPMSGASHAPLPARRRVALMPITVALAGGALVAAVATWALIHPVPEKPEPVRFAVIPPAGRQITVTGADRDLTLSPDGRHLVYVSGPLGATQLMVRSIDRLEAEPVQGASPARHPFVSPDGRWIGFFTGRGEIRKVPIEGGAPMSLCSVQGVPRGASWGPDDTIVFGTSTGTGLLSVPAGGGEPKVLTTPETSQQDHVFPFVLPGGRAVLFTVSTNVPENVQVAVLDLTTGRTKVLIRGGSHAEYVEPGYLVYAAAGSLRAVRFDPVTLDLVGDPVPVVDQVMAMASGAAEFSVSRQGSIVYLPGRSGVSDASRSLVWVDRQGREEAIKAPPRAYHYPRISPDGTRVALDIRDQQNDIWIWNLARETLTRLTDDPGLDRYPVWMPDGQRIAFSSTRAGPSALFWQPADNTGAVERLTSSPYVQWPTSAAPDGQRIVFRDSDTGNRLRGDLQLVQVSSANDVRPLMQTEFNEDNGEVSPDGRWLAYQTDEFGRNEVHVRTFPNTGSGHWQISTTGGSKPLWARSGRELFYLDSSEMLMAVPVQTTPTFSPGTPVKIVDRPYYAGETGRTYDVSPDGKRFLRIKDSAAADQSRSMVVVLNWTEELKAKLPAK